MQFKLKYREILLFVFFGMFPWICFGQILNVDRENEDADLQKSYWLLSASLDKDKQVKDIQDVSVYVENIQLLGVKGYGITSMFQYDATISGSSEVQNEGFLQVRYRDLDLRKISADPFVQYQWNGLWGMDKRILYGANARIRLFDTEGEDSYFGLGLFRQLEQWSGENGVVDDEQWRINLNLKIATKITEKIDFVNQMYYQIPLELNKVNFDYRIYNYSEVVYEIDDKFQVGFNVDVFYNNLPLGDIEKLMYGYGFNFRVLL